MTPRDPAAPPAPSRVRVVRPGFYRSPMTGSLAPDVRDALIGMATLADDEGWLLWSPDEIATTLYPYAPAKRRRLDLERRAGALESAGLLVIEACGCALLPSLKEHHGLKSGRQTTPIWAWHQRHLAEFRGMPRQDAERSDSVSSSSSGSDSVPDSSSSRATAPASGGAVDDREPVCIDCKRRGGHYPSCPQWLNPALAAVQ